MARDVPEYLRYFVILEYDPVRSETVWHEMRSSGVRIKAPGDFTVVYDPFTGSAAVESGCAVNCDYLLHKVYMLGDGNGGFMNGADWSFGEECDRMTEKGGGVFELTFDRVEAGAYYFSFLLDPERHSYFGFDAGTVLDGGAFGAVYCGGSAHLILTAAPKGRASRAIVPVKQ
ncbi:MAG: hypothetical protein IJU52_02775 [Clostridia bacterium]|nr:hypothetical protein [Clostridia bacterium]